MSLTCIGWPDGTGCLIGWPCHAGLSAKLFISFAGGWQHGRTWFKGAVSTWVLQGPVNESPLKTKCLCCPTHLSLPEIRPKSQSKLIFLLHVKLSSVQQSFLASGSQFTIMLRSQLNVTVQCHVTDKDGDEQACLDFDILKSVEYLEIWKCLNTWKLS